MKQSLLKINLTVVKNTILNTLQRKIIRDVNKNPWTSAKMIVSELATSGLDVSRKTVVRALCCGGLHGHRPRKALLLLQQYIKARLNFARNNLKHKSDETKPELFGHLNAAFVW
uniref:Transposase Tc1-like domain-containing protein n=1 Tax=Astyanax mexicanus TaxID=7994 RepID=A0A8B9JGC2_ASTMX